jgi:hypothetical protein
MVLNFRLCPLRDGIVRCTFSSTDDDLRDAMAWHTPPCRGVARLPIDSKIAQNKHCLASPHLAHASAFHSMGISQGIPHRLSSSPPHIR